MTASTDNTDSSDSEDGRGLRTAIAAYVIPQEGFTLRRKSTTENVLIAGFVTLIFILPFLTSNSYVVQVGTFFLMFASLTVSWNLIAGYQGSFSFAHAAFYGFGGYASALAAMSFGISPWAAMILAMVATAVIAVPIAYPVIRLRGPYVAMVTLAYGEILRRIAQNWVGLTRGPQGLWGIPSLFPGLSGLAAGTAHYYTAFGIFVFTVGSIYIALRSRFGLVIQAIHDSEYGARAVGININQYKLAGFVFGSSFAGLVGGFYAHYIGLMSPQQLSLSTMIEIMVMGLIGGLGTFTGPIAGTALLLVVGEYLRGFGAWRLFLYAVTIIVVTLIAPGGLVEIKQRAIELSGRSERRIIEKNTDTDSSDD